MRFLADETVPRPAVTLLEHAGHDIIAIHSDDLEREDVQVLDRGRREGRVLLTFDRDFGDLIFHRWYPDPPGVVYVRWRSVTPETLATRVHLLAVDDAANLPSMFTILLEDGLRRPPLPR